MEVLSWIFKSVLSEVLRTTFYCTTREPTRLRTVYYRRPLWNEICRRSANNLFHRDGNFCRMENPRVARNVIAAERRKCGLDFHFSQIRWIPKAVGVRAIQVTAFAIAERQMMSIVQHQPCLLLRRNRSCLPLGVKVRLESGKKLCTGCSQSSILDECGCGFAIRNPSSGRSFCIGTY